MFDLSSIYRPETAMPKEGYREYMPSKVLSPFIRCFWETKEYSRPVMIIPDTCMDIVFSFVGEELLNCGFCAIDDCTNLLDKVNITQFGIRFYAWSACLFTPESFSGTYSPLDITEKFGYSDQSHLLRDFRRFHSMLPSEAMNDFEK